MAFQYSKVSWNMITLLANLVFIKNLNFQWWILTSRHTLFLFNVPLVKLFGPSYSFLQSNLCILEIDLLESNINFCINTCILTSLVKGMPKLNTLPRCVKCWRCTFHHNLFIFCVRMDKFPPSSLTYEITLSNKLYEEKNSFTCASILALVISTTSTKSWEGHFYFIQNNVKKIIGCNLLKIYKS